MYLKNLTVLGFKSFADKTSLNFQPGVTAIVGPNGCGKSNVSDAIRWVLGEQSAKALRGAEMADVIFNGTDGRKPVGMAEVSLTIGGVDEEHLRAAGVEMAYNEVTVTRRVFRDGGSEYFINKTPCRLRDIQQLFMGTGVGRTSYSIMAQGNITQILSSKPEDRRMIFEEAAGITKYKTQKKEALRKLEYTEQNLLRIADLVREVKRQIGSLQRQAGKARRYKEISHQLQHLDTQWARHQYDVLHASIEARTLEGSQLREQIENNSAQALQAEDEIAQLRGLLSELESQISGIQHRGMELKAEIDGHQNRIQYNEERLAEIAAQNSKGLAEINQSEERRSVAQQELDVVLNNLEKSNAAVVQHRNDLRAKQEAVQSIESTLHASQESLRQVQSLAFAAAQELAKIRNEITALDLQKQGHTIRLEKLSAEKIQLEEERSGLEVRLKDFAVTVNEQKLSAQSQRGTVEERQARLREIQSELETAGRQQDKVLEEQAEKRSRLDLLEQLASEHEGFSAGSLAALRQSQNVLGSLADKIRVPDQFVTAIETALGHHLQLVLTEESGAAKQILEDLKNAKKGRASIAALALTRNDGFPKGSELDPGLNTDVLQGAVAAASVVECEDSVRPLLTRLLDTTRIVKDLEEALTAFQSGQSQFNYVTLTGEILSRHGVFTGGQNNGQTNGKAPSSILGRKNQITSLTKALAELQIRVAELSRAKGALQSEQTALNASLQDAQTELRAQEVAIATREGEFLALQNSQRLLHQKIDTVVYEIQSLAAQEKEGAEKRHALVSHAAQAESREQDSQAKVTQLTHDLESLRKDRDSANAALTDSRVSLAADEQLLASFEQQRISLGQRVRELSERIAQRKSELGSFVTRKEQAETEIEKSRMRIEGLQHEREQVSEQVAALVSEKQSQDAEVGRREETLREQRRALSGLQEKRGAIEVELAQKNMSVENLSDRIRQKYQLNIADIRSECITITLADEGAAKVHVMTPEEMANSGAATDWESVAQEVQALQRRIEEMGPVNLVAIEEYEETEQRHQFLSQQHDDLVQAKAQLLEVINRINVQTREMFRITFEQIRDNFRAMFTEVFGGGKADLVMMDENDVLESGIEIVAKPPGKQLQTISLLSGGEQTMTAVSLLFSIYQVKPSPFCVLDELDAPLDESNINRFIRVLQRFLTHSQFIIITHNKRTIGMADVLYGVTMQEQGVSRIVSVKFHKSDEETDGKAVGLETPTSVRSVDKEEDAPHRREETMEIVMAK